MKVTIDIPDELIKAIASEVAKQIASEGVDSITEDECSHSSYMAMKYTTKGGVPIESRRCADCSKFLGEFRTECLMSEGNCKSAECPTHGFIHKP